MESAPIGANLTMKWALTWDVVDLASFVLWFVVYLPHVHEAEQSTFVALGAVASLMGFWMLVSGIRTACYSLAQADKSVYSIARPTMMRGMPHGMPKREHKVEEVTEVTWDTPLAHMTHKAFLGDDQLDKWSSVEGARGGGTLTVVDTSDREVRDQKRLAVAHHLWREVAYDVFQIVLIGWLMEKATLNEGEETFPGKLGVDFLNFATTLIDFLVLKGPSALCATGCSPEAILGALKKDLEMYRRGQLTEDDQDLEK